MKTLPRSFDRKRRARLLLAGCCSALAVILLSYMVFRWFAGMDLVRTDNAYTRGEITTVAPQVAGHVAEVLVADNQAVQEGQVLFRIDDADYRARLADAEAGVARQEQVLRRIDREIDLQAAVIAQAGAEVGAARVESSRAATEASRYGALVGSSLVSRQTYDTAKATHRKAEASWHAAEARRQAEIDRREVLRAQRSELESALEQARAARELAATALDRTVVRAPIDGVVGNRQVRVGRYVAPGAPALAIVPLRDVWVVANFKETQLSGVQVGDRAVVQVDMHRGVEIPGVVDSIAPGSGAQFALIPPDNATGNFTRIPQRLPVKVVLDSGHPLAGKLYAGLSAEVTIFLGSDDGRPAARVAVD